MMISNNGINLLIELKRKVDSMLPGDHAVCRRVP